MGGVRMGIHGAPGGRQGGGKHVEMEWQATARAGAWRGAVGSDAVGSSTRSPDQGPQVRLLPRKLTGAVPAPRRGRPGRLRGAYPRGNW